MSSEKNVTYGKPAVAGAISSAPVGTTLPTDAVAKLEDAFKNLGYISEDGLVNAAELETESIKAWGGDTVLVVQTGKEDTFTYTLIEALNTDVLKQVYGETNVKGDLSSGITIEVNSKPLESHSLVIDMILKEGVLKRIVIPNASVAEVGEITYADEDAIGYETTIKAIPDSKGNTHYEYIIKPAKENGGSGNGEESGD